MSDIKELVYQDLTHRIITQDLKPGERLVEKDIMERYTIGKTPLREVMLLLQLDGLIKRFPRSGTIVAPIDFIELREVAEIRLALERLISEIVLDRITPPEIDHIEKMTEDLTEFAKDGLSPKFITTECHLHTALYNSCKNTKLAKLLNEHQHFFARMWYSFERSYGDIQSQLRDWQKVAVALRTKDNETMETVYQGHFKTFYQTLSLML